MARHRSLRVAVVGCEGVRRASMTTFGIAMVKDECDVIEGTIRHLADEGMAGIVIADNGSTDGTREILDELAHDESLPCPLHVFDDPEIGYYQSRKVSALAEVAGGFGADWIVPFDADERWIAHIGRTS